MDKEKDKALDPIYELDGKVPVGKAIPFGLQHILAMFVANIAPILIVAGVIKMPVEQSGALVQSAMLIAGIGTLIQLYPVWRVGSGLPIVMGISFTFVSIACVIGSKYGYGGVLGAVLVGGILEGFLGLFAKYWRRFIPPIVAATVVTSIGFSLLAVGANSFGGGFGNPNFGDAQYIIVGTITLFSCIGFNIFAKSFYKQLSVLFGLVVGYVVAFCMGMVDLSGLASAKLIAVPQLLPFELEFHPDAIFAFFLIFLVSATETIGDTSAMTAIGLRRNVTEREVSGSITCDGFISSLSSVFGCMPITSFSQNVGLIAMTGVVNRFAIMTGAVIMILAGLFPALGVLLASLPESVLGGCTLMMFGSIVVSGVQMIAGCGYSNRNITIASLALSIGIGFTQAPAIFKIAPDLVKNVFAENCVAVVFIVAMALNVILPTDINEKK
ncbi:nucleobase:cation symporter-2 family protein [uncultured Phascolarctobacterium sp.]|uniref:uracil-xanthine permease family protein n=1 Tax=uncultured Phascolarctobacterium sp. TaxID=512296 RepID=UPI0025E92D7A|nr:nucleobase:cation symporter-2 family protein [uncultured Phascolarctobacterium sp.]